VGKTRRRLCRRNDECDPTLEEAALGVGGGELGGLPTVWQSIRGAARAAEQVGASGVEEVVLLQLRVEVEGVEEGEASIRTLGILHGDRSVEVDDGRRGHLAEAGVEGGDTGEVRGRSRRGGRVPGVEMGGQPGQKSTRRQGVKRCRWSSE
jgi:hypothetical protein